MSAPNPGRRPQSGSFSPPRPPARPAIAIPTPVQRAVELWSKAALTERPAWELERALDIVCKHPDAYSGGYSVASTARRRLMAEMTRRLEEKLNKLNTTRKPQPLS